MSRRLLRLPSFYGLESAQQDRVIAELRRWLLE
jgi:dTDP-4-amino-4,6-dideoxygalactose transaminase